MNFIITYSCLDKNGESFKTGQIKVKNKRNSMHAQVSLENYFSRKLPEFHRLIVHHVEEDNILNDFFGGIFGI